MPPVAPASAAAASDSMVSEAVTDAPAPEELAVSPPEAVEGAESDGGNNDAMLDPEVIRLLDLGDDYGDAPADVSTEEDQEAEAGAEAAAEAEKDDSPKAPDDPEAEAKAEAEDEEVPTAEDDKRVATLVELRDKYRSQRDEARNQVEDLQERIAQLESGAVSLSPSERNPLADLTTAEAIQERMKQADAVIAWAKANPEGAVFEDERSGESIEFSAAEVAERRLAAEKTKEIHGPKRLEYLAAHRQATEFAKQVYPEMYEAGPFADFADQIISGNPGLLENPNYPCQVGDMIMGAAVRQGIYKIVPVKAAASAAKATGQAPAADNKSPNPDDPAQAAAASNPPVSTRNGSTSPTPPAQPRAGAPPRRASGQVAAGRVREKFNESGDVESLAALLAAT